MGILNDSAFAETALGMLKMGQSPEAPIGQTSISPTLKLLRDQYAGYLKTP